MTQATMFGSLEVVDHSDDGFEEWWKLFPKDKRHTTRKSQKSVCLEMWRGKKNLSTGYKVKIYLQKDRVIAALKEDIKSIEKGAFKKYPTSHDNMEVFPGTHPWLYQMRWDRDVEPVRVTPAPPPRPVDQHNPMTPQEKEAILPICRLLAQRRASIWPRGGATTAP